MFFYFIENVFGKNQKIHMIKGCDKLVFEIYNKKVEFKFFQNA